MKRLLITIFLLFSTFGVAGTRHKGIVTFNTISGSGIGYGYRINKSWFIEFNGFVYFEGEDPSKELETHLLLGFELQRSIWHKGNNRFYGFIGTSFWYVERAIEQSRFVEPREIFYTKYDINRIFNTGFGIGWELDIGKGFYFSASLGLQYQLSEPYLIGELIDRNPSGTSFFGPGAGLSLKYGF